jgi:hypothetical protein
METAYRFLETKFSRGETERFSAKSVFDISCVPILMLFIGAAVASLNVERASQKDEDIFQSEPIPAQLS